MIEKGFCSFFGAYAKVYTLSDSDGNIFYVGCTIQPIEHRISVHISDAKANKGNQKKNKIIRSLKFKIVVRIVDIRWVTSTTSYPAAGKIKGIEKEWMIRLFKQGYDLCNKDIWRLQIMKPDLQNEFVGQTFSVQSKGKYLAEITENKVRVLETEPQNTVDKYQII